MVVYCTEFHTQCSAGVDDWLRVRTATYDDDDEGGPFNESTHFLHRFCQMMKHQGVFFPFFSFFSFFHSNAAAAAAIKNLLLLPPAFLSPLPKCFIFIFISSFLFYIYISIYQGGLLYIDTHTHAHAHLIPSFI